MPVMTRDLPRRAVVMDVPPMLEAWRKRIGADRFDEMWEGVLHMPPAPTLEHQSFEFQIEWWLTVHWVPLSKGRVFHNVNVVEAGRRKWTHNYRSPDLLLVLRERLARGRGSHFAGGPNVIVEIRSPGDESYDKLPFYFAVGVEEAWIIDCDTKVPELFVRGAKAFRKAKANRAGWLVSKVTGVEMRAAANGQLALRLGGDLATQAMVPPDSSH